MEYLFGGMSLETGFRFEQLHELNQRNTRQRLSIADATTVPPADHIVHRNPGRYRMTSGRFANGWVFRSRFPDVFVFSPAECRVDCHIASAEPRAWQDVLFRRILPRIAATYGATIVHAATIATSDRCLLLLGRSGAGKSTLTTYCATAGWQVLSDDTTVLWTNDGFVAEPVQHGTGVWEDARAALSLPLADCVPMPGYDGRKWCYQPARSGYAQPRMPSAILLLERSSAVLAPCLSPLTRDETLHALVGQSIPFLPQPPGAAAAMSFGRSAFLARQVPGFRLTYPDGYAALPEVETLLRSMPLVALPA